MQGQVHMAIRNRVVAFTMALAAVTYLDRVCIGVLAAKISTELDLSRVQMAISSAPLPSPMPPSACPGPLVRPRRRPQGADLVVLVWSVFTMATAAAWNFVSMAVIRFLFGIGEAGAWPSVARVYSRWIPLAQRGRIQGIFFAGAHLSGGVTPLVVIAMAGWLQWRMIFIVFGTLGALWAVCWHIWFRDEPRDHASVSAEERDHIEATRGLADGSAGGRQLDPGVQDADRGAAVHPGFRQQLWLLFLHHLAADLSGPGARHERRGAGDLFPACR